MTVFMFCCVPLVHISAAQVLVVPKSSLHMYFLCVARPASYISQCLYNAIGNKILYFNVVLCSFNIMTL